MARYLRYLAPGLTPAHFTAVASALRGSGYSVLPAGTGEMLLNATARSLIGDAGSFVEVKQSGGDWDPHFARTLSAEIDGFVLTSEYHSFPGEYGEALFFAGRTLQARRWRGGADDIDYGPPRDDGDLLGPHVQELYNLRFEALCSPYRELLSEGSVLATEDWETTPHPVTFTTAQETGFTLMMLGNIAQELGEQIVFATDVPGWRRRIRSTRGLALPYVEMRREGGFNAGLAAELADRLQCTAVMLEVPGAARSFRWAHAYNGNLEGHGEAHSATEFVRALAILGWELGEPPGMMFGFGPHNWLEPRQSSF